MNVILITIDCLRSDHVSCLGYHKRTTRNLDNLAKEGVLFSQAISTGTNTLISFPGILASSYPQYRAKDRKWLPKDKPLISEILKKGGYKTAAFHSAPFLSRYFSYDRGFDVFYDSFVFKHSKIGGKIMGSKYEMYKGAVLKAKLLFSTFMSPYIPYEECRIINKRAIQWLQNNAQSGEFFLWLHYMDTHFPYSILKKYSSWHLSKSSVNKIMRKMVLNKENITDSELKLIIEMYDSAIRYVDAEIGLFMEKLKEMDLYDSSLIVVTADHGDEFREHGSIGHGSIAHARPQKPYDELIHVPLIIRCPGLGKGLIIEQVVSLLDIAPTILDSIGFQRENEFLGESLLTVIRKRRKTSGVISESYIFRAQKEIISYRTSEWKLIVDKNTNEYELYNLKEDPGETKNLYKIEMDKAEEMMHKILYHERLKEREKMKRHIKKLKRKI